MQHPPACCRVVNPSSMEQQYHQQQRRYYVPLRPQPQPTTTSAQEEEEEEEDRTLWIGNLQNWMDKVEEKEVRTLWIGDLQHWMDEAYIDSCFAHTGEVFTRKVIRNGKSDETCYGFIEFKSHAIAERFLHKFNGTPMPLVVVGTSNFSLNWASSSSSSSSSFGSGGEDDRAKKKKRMTVLLRQEDRAAADDKLQKMTVLVPPPQGTRTPRPTDLEVNSSWEDMLKWWSIMAEKTPTPELVYATHRVYMIGAFIKNHRSFEDHPDELIEELLDELPRHVVSIDIAKVLHSIDALHPLFRNLLHPHTGIRGKVPKVIIAMLQNNPTSQQLLLEEAGGALLDAFLTDIDPTFETKFLDTIYSVYLNDKSDISEFGQTGYKNLKFALKYMSENSQRRALNLTARLVKEHKSDYYIIVTELEEFPRLMMQLVSSSVDAEVQKAALRCLIVLAETQKVVNNCQGLKIDDMLMEFLPGWIDGIIEIAPENLAPFIDEISLVEKLWNVCYNESSRLREKEGLSVLLGEDTLASDDVEADDRN